MIRRIACCSLAALACLLVDASAALAPLPRAGFVGVQAGPAPEGQGVSVQSLVPAGSAREAGVLVGDVVTHVNGQAVANAGEFVGAVTRLKAGQSARLKVLRQSVEHEITVPLKPRPFEKFAGLETEYGAVEVDGHRRRTLLTVPPGEGKRPAVLFVTGVGCFSQEFANPQSSVAQLLHGLTRAGMLTLRVEKSGMGDSEGPACQSPQADLRHEVRGYVAGLRALRKDPRVDPDRIFLVGLSIGGIHAPLILRDEPIRGAVVINTAAKPFFEYLLETRRRQMLLAKTPHHEVDARMPLATSCAHAVLLEKLTPEQAIAREPRCGAEVQFPAPYTFMQQWASLNLADEWRRSKAPVLVVIGKSDFVATVEESPYLVDLLNAYQPGRAKLAAIDGMDHSMERAPSMEASLNKQGPGEFHSRVLDEILLWIRSQGA